MAPKVEDRVSVAALQAGGCPESLVAFAVGTRPVGKGAGAVRALSAFAVGMRPVGKGAGA